MKATDAVSVNFKSFNWENDIIRLKEVFPEITLMSPSLDSWRQRAFAGGIEAGDGKVAALGVTPEYLTITNRVLQAGRNINPYHVEARSPVCVIGYDIAKTLFLRISAIGQIVTITNGAGSNYPCQVIGVLAPSSSNEEWAPPNLQIMLPFTYFQTVSGSWWDSQIHEAVLRIDSNADIENTGKSIRSFFEQRYGKSGRFSVDSNSTLVAQMKKFLNIFGILLVSIAILSLVVGGIGINNMMLVSVTERIKEFGIRKALGATDRSIRIQVLMESMILCAVAGVLGVVFGFTIYEVLIFGATKFVPQLKFEWVFEPLAAVLSLFSIVAVGIASGFIPALKAEKLQVIEALRSE
jgi:putative ABC transport system permease protein